jgi:hypothetical protein
VASRGARALPAPSTLVDALGSAGEDLRHHNTCALAAMAGSALNNDGRQTNGERASDAGDCHAGERCRE